MGHWSYPPVEKWERQENGDWFLSMADPVTRNEMLIVAQWDRYKKRFRLLRRLKGSFDEVSPPAAYYFNGDYATHEDADKALRDAKGNADAIVESVTKLLEQSHADAILKNKLLEVTQDKLRALGYQLTPETLTLDFI